MRWRYSSFTTSRSDLKLASFKRERRHPLGLGPENRIQIIGRHDLVINGHILRGVGVVFTADVLRQVVESIGREMVVPLKHHVLEEMGETASLVRIILRPDVIPDLHRHRRAGMIFHGVNLQSVGQSLVLELQRRDGDRGSGSLPPRRREERHKAGKGRRRE